MNPIPDPNASGVGRATVHVQLPGGDCSGTLIAPSWVLTAAHCVATLSPSSIFVLVPGQAVQADACFVHPRALGFITAPLVDCVTAPPVVHVNYRAPHDLALVHLSTALRGNAVRNIGPPRVCARQIAPPSFPTLFRGAASGLGLAAGTSAHDGNGGLSVVTTSATSAGPSCIVIGDSGGTFTVAPSDATGPVIAVESNGSNCVFRTDCGSRDSSASCGEDARVGAGRLALPLVHAPMGPRTRRLFSRTRRLFSRTRPFVSRTR